MIAHIDPSATIQDGMLIVMGTWPKAKRGKYVLDKTYTFTVGMYYGTFHTFNNRRGVEMWKVQIEVGMSWRCNDMFLLSKEIRWKIKHKM